MRQFVIGRLFMVAAPAKRVAVTTTMALAIYLFLVTAAEFCEATEFDINSLRGHPLRMSVFVENVSDELKREGLRVEDFLRDMELKLRSAGIEIVPMYDPQYIGAGTLYLRLSTTKYYPSSQGIGAARIGVNSQHSDSLSIDFVAHLFFVQPVQLVREPSITHPLAATWMHSATDSGNVSHVRSIVKDLVDTFLNDWLTANPQSPR